MEAERNNLCQQLESEEKSVRRAALLDLKKRAERKDLDGLPYLLEPLVKIVSSDKVDSLRESASIVLLFLTSSLKINSQQFQDIVNLTVERFEVEPAEEVCLTLAKIIHAVIVNQSNQAVYLENLDKLTQSVKVMVRDRYGEVVKEACDIIIWLSEKNDHFRLQADFFVEPLMQNLKTQPMKVRVMCVKALEPIMIHSPLTILNIAPDLEKCWSDSSPPLKLAMVQTVGKVSQEVESDDQNFHLLLPVILLGRCNDFIEVSEEAESFWQLLQNQPDAENWSNDMRIQTAQLLYQFVREIPDRKLELSTVMEILTFQSGDEQAAVRNWAWRSARLIGETCAEEALEWLSNRKQEEIEANSSCDLTIYSHIVRGFLLSTQSNYSPRTLDLCVQLAVKFSTTKDISLLECLESLVEKDVGIPAEPMNQLVSVALSLEGSKESDFSSRQMSLMARMAVRLEYPNVETMIQQRLPALLTSEGEPGQWTTTSPSWRILQFVAGDMKMIDGYVFDLLRQTISSNPNPEVKLKSFNILTASMEHLQSIDPAQLQAILLASVKWKPGRSASVLRSSAALCAYAAIHHRKLEIIPSNVNIMADSFVDWWKMKWSKLG
ncbi:hypothetical protein DAPPUDRAFT_119461 [Daphnia pulex]|uniref:Dynein axonemal assembly factor 5 TPR repeats domain-containing protein n=1 Tax=Daphnia pulex TaxID=6669 RepID=E9HYK7_DAPPU|nr:hypothetical protein DAPPUDRAFT_301540 [Daphnia pulex]EFX63175.1 hypothetical protein DAPPUDRAFT_119461 [Daphnia pulex]|eukprot:EFX62296.1 hypothetical protein DAPPUDRAFT_301540 [Daphnia pulex]